ncbi:suppressor of fused domain protein [Alteribacter natronophilus]|uniref:suppressor of fused domain protein n=1 Tax=Alteribacter natronophilus TaxID=2583810 RepID=UPI00110E1301|nr:suppressor of fused domain protein [Alteribacter natronophilus]TMW73338.1 suppressor of fused domain protein [Alteribacter natronophilus]
MTAFTDFLEKHMGTIDCGWHLDQQGRTLPFQIVKFNGGPFPETVTYSTLGLSRDGFSDEESGETVRQELIFVTGRDFEHPHIPYILQNTALIAVNSNRPFFRGDVIGPFGPMFDDADMEAFYVTVPVYFENTFHSYRTADGTPYRILWLIPVTAPEAEYAEKYGWGAFEDLLEKSEPDLTDVYRPSLV